MLVLHPQAGIVVGYLAATSQSAGNPIRISAVQPCVFVLRKYVVDCNELECMRQIAKVRIDVSKGIFIYEDKRRGLLIPYVDEFEEVLNEYGIEYRQTGPNCTGV